MKIKILTITFFAILLCGCTNDNKSSHNEIKKIDCEEKESLMQEGAILIDVRTSSEYEDSHLDGAFNISYNLIEEKIETLAPSKDIKIIVYCQSGGRSNVAAKTLIELGYENVYDLGSIDNCSNL